MDVARLFGRLAVTVALLSVASCGSGDERNTAAGSATQTAPPSSTAVSAASTRPPSTVANAAAATVPRTSTPLFARHSEGPKIGTWISVDRAATSDTGTRVRSYSELLYAPASKEPTMVYATPKASLARSTFITGMTVSADGRTVYFAETTTELSSTPHRCAMRLMAADQSGQPRQIADGASPTIAPDSRRLAFQSAKDSSCQTTRLHVLDLATSERRDFDVADFTRLLPSPPDRPAFVQVAAAHWSPDGRWLAVVIGVPDGWAATAIVDTTDWRIQLMSPDVWLEQIATSVLGSSDNSTTRQVAVVAWTADGTLALKVSCSACGPYLYASGTPGSEAVVAEEPTLAGATRPASDRWLGSFEDWVLVADPSGIIARTNSKNVGLFELDGYAVNAAWPSGARSLPRVR